MERPSKRIKISNPEIRNPRDTGSRMTQGLFTSERGFRREDSDHEPQPTRTISLSDFQRRNILGDHPRAPRPVLPRRNAGIYLLPRAPDETITASVVEINVNDGTTTSKVTEVPAATTEAVVSLSDVGSLTVPGISDVTSVVVGSASDSSQETLTTPPPTPLTSGAPTTSSTSELSPAGSIFSEALNGTITTLLDTTTTVGRTITITSTSTFEISLVNGTVIGTASTSEGSTTSISSMRITSSSISSSSHTPTYTFGQDITTDSATFTGSTYVTSGTSSDYFTGIAGTPTSSSSAATSSESGSDSGSGSGGDSDPGLTPTQQQVVGGVVGGLAGVALVLAILLFVLRRYRRRLKSRGQLPEQVTARELASNGGDSYPMSQRSSTAPLAAVVASSLKRLRPHSNQTLATTVTGHTERSVPESERGFQRIAGRKIAPVLGSGGDPYGGNFGAFEKDTAARPSDLNPTERGLSGASFYRDSRGFYGGKGNQSPTLPPSPTTATTGARTGDMATTAGTGSNVQDFADPVASLAQNSSQMSLTTPSRPEGYAVMRPSPARTPVTLSPAASSIRLPIQQAPPTMDEDAPPLPIFAPGLTQRDGIGRSLASQDGSRVSKSSGRSAGRFMENM